MASAQITAAQQARQSATFVGMKKLSAALSEAKYAGQSQTGPVRFEQDVLKVAKYKTVNTYHTEPVMTRMPIYEGREAPKSIASGTRALDGIQSPAAAGIEEGASFQVQVGTAPPATVSLGANRLINVTIGTTTTKYGYGNEAGDFAETLAKALENVPGLQAKLDDVGQLEIETEKSTALTLTNSAFDPLASLGLESGRLELNGRGIEQVQIGTELVQTGTKQVEYSRDYVRDGEREIVLGYRAVRDPIDENAASLTSASRREIVAASQALDAAIGPAELSKGVANPLAGLRGQFNLDKLKKAMTRGDLGFAAMQVGVALKAYSQQQAAAAKGTNKLG